MSKHGKKYRTIVEKVEERLYEPAAAAFNALSANHCAKATELSQWKARMRKDWPQIRIKDVEIENSDRVNILVGDTLNLRTQVHLGSLDPKYVRVQAYFGDANTVHILNANVVDLDGCKKLDSEGDYLFSGAIPASESGAYGFNVRVIPTHPNLTQDHELRLITWAK